MHEKWIMPKKFPKPLISATQTNEDGYPYYRRRGEEEGGQTCIKGKKKLDNSWVVPYKQA